MLLSATSGRVRGLCHVVMPCLFIVKVQYIANSKLEMESLPGSSIRKLEDARMSSMDFEMGSQKMDVDGTYVKWSSFKGSPIGNAKRWSCGVFRSINTVILSNKLNLLLPFGPLAVVVHHVASKHAYLQDWIFFLSLLGIIPLAERLGYVTEQLAFFTGPIVGGLLNATFGNATELIISIQALRNKMIRVVQQSLLGSILSNMLLVLGCAFFCGGLVYRDKEQTFNKASAGVNSGLLLMSVMGILFPAALHYTGSEMHIGKSELSLSRFSSCVMLLAYGAFIFYQLKGQKDQYTAVEGDSQTSENSEDDESPEISKWESMFWLAVITICISFLSGYLVDGMEATSEAWNIPIAFISVILLPIVGNAAEHASAIIFATKDKLDISLGVAIGSSTQIAMFGIPFSVIIAWMMGVPMDLNFHLFETAVLFLTVLVVSFLMLDGKSNYFKGLMLLLCYLIVGASFFVHADPTKE